MRNSEEMGYTLHNDVHIMSNGMRVKAGNDQGRAITMDLKLS